MADRDGHPQFVRQFREPDLQARIAAILAETQLDPSTLQLEVTESVLMDDVTGRSWSTCPAPEGSRNNNLYEAATGIL